METFQGVWNNNTQKCFFVVRLTTPPQDPPVSLDGIFFIFNLLTGPISWALVAILSSFSMGIISSLPLSLSVPVVLNQSNYSPQVTLGNVWRHFWLSQSGEGGVWLEAKDAASHPFTHMAEKWLVLNSIVPMLRTPDFGVSAVVQQKWIPLVSMRTWVQFLASISGSRIRHCRELWCRLKTWLGSHVAVAVM